MKPFQVLRDPKAFQLLADETRRKILYLLRVKEMTVSQIATELNLTPQALYHHIKKLMHGNMVEVVREERCGHLIESYYRATAEDFLLTVGKISAQTLHDKKLAEEQVNTVLKTLNKLGFNLKFDDKKISELVDLRAGLITRCCSSDEKFERAQDEIWNAEELDLLTKEIATEFAGTLLMSDEDFANQQKTREKIRNFLHSLTPK